MQNSSYEAEFSTPAKWWWVKVGKFIPQSSFNPSLLPRGITRFQGKAKSKTDGGILVC